MFFVGVHMIVDACGIQKGMQDSLKLELQVVGDSLT